MKLHMNMKRDMDLIRSTMLDIVENGVVRFGPASDEDLAGMDPEEIAKVTADADVFTYHLKLMEEAQYIRVKWMMDGTAVILFVTNKGHDFNDAVRDPEIWAATKAGVEKAKGFSLDLLAALAKGFVKKKIEDTTGIAIDL